MYKCAHSALICLSCTHCLQASLVFLQPANQPPPPNSHPAGCLPTLATIPVFIALYRALSKAADDGLLTDGFFWIPSLGGPTSLAMRTAVRGTACLCKNCRLPVQMKRLQLRLA